MSQRRVGQSNASIRQKRNVGWIDVTTSTRKGNRWVAPEEVFFLAIFRWEFSEGRESSLP